MQVYLPVLGSTLLSTAHKKGKTTWGHLSKWSVCGPDLRPGNPGRQKRLSAQWIWRYKGCHWHESSSALNLHTTWTSRQITRTHPPCSYLLPSAGGRRTVRLNGQPDKSEALPLLLLTNAHGTGKYSAYYQRWKVNTNSNKHLDLQWWLAWYAGLVYVVEQFPWRLKHFILQEAPWTGR